MRFLIITIVIVCVIQGCDFKTSQSYFEEALEFEKKGKYEEAILLLDKAIEKNPNFLGAYINRGANKSALGNYRESIQDYNKVLRRDPENVLALFNKANNLKRLEKWHEAINIYNQIIELKGGKYIQIDHLTNPYIRNKKTEFDVQSVEIQYERALAFVQTDSLEQAYYGFQFCIDNNYLNKESLNEIGNIYFLTNNLQKSCEYFEKSAKLGDKDAIYNFNEFCK